MPRIQGYSKHIMGATTVYLLSISRLFYVKHTSSFYNLFKESFERFLLHSIIGCGLRVMVRVGVRNFPEFSDCLRTSHWYDYFNKANNPKDPSHVVKGAQIYVPETLSGKSIISTEGTDKQVIGQPTK